MKMIKTSIALIGMVLFSNTIHAQITHQQTYELTDVRSFGGVGMELAGDLAIDAEGNQYLLGRYRNAFDDGNGITDDANGSDRLFLQKVSLDGTVVWTKLITSTNNHASPGKIDFDSDNNVYVFFSGDRNDLTIDPSGANISPQIAQDPGTFPRDLFLWKIRPDGNTAWVKTFGGDYKDVGRSIVVDDQDNIIIAGSFQFTANFEPDQGPHIPSVSNTGYTISSLDFSNAGYDGFVAKLDSSGQALWVSHFKGDNKDEVTDIAVDHQGNIAVAGWTVSNDFQFPNTGANGLLNSNNRDGFAGRLTTNGIGVTVAFFTGPGVDGCHDIVVDANQNAYVSISSSSSQLTFGGATHTLNWGLYDALVAKFDGMGNYNWHHLFASDANDRVGDITIGPDQSLYVAGRVESITLQGGQFGNTSAASSHDMYLANLGSDGTLNHFSITGGPGIEEAEDVEFHTDGTMFIYGVAQTDVLFRVDTTMDTLANTGNRDVFLARGWDCHADMVPEISFAGDSMVSNLNVGVSFEWIYDDGNTLSTYPSNGNPFLTNLTDSGAYALVVTYYNCEADTSNFLVFQPNTGGNAGLETTKFLKFSVYPNPTQGQVVIQTQEHIQYTCHLFDVNGRQVMVSDNATKLDISRLEQGLYILKISSAQGSFETKILKQ